MIRIFNTTIQNFIRVVLSKLEKMNANQYVAALYDFFNYEHADKLIANPVRGSGYYFGVDTVELRHIPRETAPGSGEFRIYEYYEVKLLQALLKMDFYKALEAGYTIRKCAYCERSFLLKGARHTKYCDLPKIIRQETCHSFSLRFYFYKLGIQNIHSNYLNIGGIIVVMNH